MGWRHDLDCGERLLIVYDGNCGFCRTSIQAIRRRDRYGVFRYVPRQTPGIEREYPQVEIGDFNTGIRLIDAKGGLYVGSDAIHQIASRLPYFRRLAWLYKLPVVHGFTKRVYAWIAENRMKLSQYCERGGACKIDTNDLSEGDIVDNNKR